MRRVLRRLNDVPGVKGSLVVSKDGMVVASNVSRGLDGERVAAIAADVLRSTSRAFETNGLRQFTRLTLVASHGKLVFTDAGNAFLVVISDRNVDLGPVEIEIESATMRIRSQGELRV